LQFQTLLTHSGASEVGSVLGGIESEHLCSFSGVAIVAAVANDNQAKKGHIACRDEYINLEDSKALAT